MTEGILLVYGIPNSTYQIISKEAAISMAEQAKAQGKIQDYRIVEKNDKAGHIIATLPPDIKIESDK